MKACPFHSLSPADLIRSIGIILPTLLLGSVWISGFFSTIIALIFAWCIAIYFNRCVHWKRRWFKTLIIILILTFCFAAYDNLISTSLTSHGIWRYLYDVTTGSLIFTVISLVFAIPAWLFYWASDHLLCKWIDSWH